MLIPKGLNSEAPQTPTSPSNKSYNLEHSLQKGLNTFHRVNKGKYFPWCNSQNKQFINCPVYPLSETYKVLIW